jgi:Peptidase family M28
MGSEGAEGEVVIGAHYDSVAGTVGANDNAISSQRRWSLHDCHRGLSRAGVYDWHFLVNEEPPYFQANDMGSLVCARQLRREGVAVSAMISLETIGFYSDASGSQRYPPVLSFFYPSRGNFVGFVGNSESHDLVRSAIRKFRESTKFPSEGVAAPGDWPASDGRITGGSGKGNIRRS